VIENCGLKIALAATTRQSLSVMGMEPVVKSAKPKRWYRVGKYQACLFGEIESMGFVQYLHIFAVFGEDSKGMYFVTAEVNLLAGGEGAGSHFLCVFDDGKHLNYGDSDQWADEETFVTEALRLAREKFGAEE